jgi:hypothetical protein
MEPLYDLSYFWAHYDIAPSIHGLMNQKKYKTIINNFIHKKLEAFNCLPPSIYNAITSGFHCLYQQKFWQFLWQTIQHHQSMVHHRKKIIFNTGSSVFLLIFIMVFQGFYGIHRGLMMISLVINLIIVWATKKYMDQLNQRHKHTLNFLFLLLNLVNQRSIGQFKNHPAYFTIIQQQIKGASPLEIIGSFDEFHGLCFQNQGDINGFFYEKIHHHQQKIHREWDLFWGFFHSFAMVLIMTNGLILFINSMVNIMGQMNAGGVMIQ